MLKKLLSIIFVALIFTSCSPPQPEVDVSKPLGYVSDFAGIIPQEASQKLTALAGELENKTGAELAIVTLPDLSGQSVEDYAVYLFQQWGIGKKGQDNGVLVLVGVAERKMRIEVGYGLEGIIPDGLAGEIIRERITPAFKADDYGNGLLLGALAISQTIAKDAGVQLSMKGPAPGRVYAGRRRKRSLFGSLANIIFVIILLPFIFLRRLLSPFGYRRRGYWGSGFGGFGGGGSFGGGGGFGGFGGGMSGGGGASGGW